MPILFILLLYFIIGCTQPKKKQVLSEDSTAPSQLVSQQQNTFVSKRLPELDFSILDFVEEKKIKVPKILETKDVDVLSFIQEHYKINRIVDVDQLPDLDEATQSMVLQMQKQITNDVIKTFLRKRMQKQSTLPYPRLFSLGKIQFWDYGINKIPDSYRLHLILDWMQDYPDEFYRSQHDLVRFFYEHHKEWADIFSFVKDQQSRIEGLLFQPLSASGLLRFKEYMTVPLQLTSDFFEILSKSIIVLQFLNIFPEIARLNTKFLDLPFVQNFFKLILGDARFKQMFGIDELEALDKFAKAGMNVDFHKKLINEMRTGRLNVIVSLAMSAVYGLVSLPTRKAKTEQDLRDMVYPALVRAVFFSSLQHLLEKIEAVLKTAPESVQKSEFGTFIPYLLHSSKSKFSKVFKMSQDLLDVKDTKNIFSNYVYFHKGTGFLEYLAQNYDSLTDEYIHLTKYLSLMEVASWIHLENSPWNFVSLAEGRSFDVKELAHPLIPYSKIVTNNFSTKEERPHINAEGQNGQGKTTLISMLLYAVKFGTQYGIAPVGPNSTLPRISHVVVNEDTRSLFGVVGEWSHYQLQLLQLFQTLWYIIKLQGPFMIALDETLSGTDPQTGRYLMAEVIRVIYEKSEKNKGIYFWSNHFVDSASISPAAVYITFDNKQEQYGILKNSHKFFVSESPTNQDRFKPYHSDSTELAFAASYELANLVGDQLMIVLISNAYRQWQADLQETQK